MKSIFSASGRAALARRIRRGTLLAFDFDGTLAGLVRDPQKARLSGAIQSALRELATRAPVVIVSGRALTDLKTRVDGTVPYFIGNHGLESPISPSGAAEQAKDICVAWQAQLLRSGNAALRATGAIIEDKTYSLSFHYRSVARKAHAHTTILGILRGLFPLPRLILGKAVINAIPPGSPNKGTALFALMTHLQSHGALYIGDDDTDEDVFGLDPGVILGVRVGKSSVSRAQFYLNRQESMSSLLRHLTGLLD